MTLDAKAGPNRHTKGTQISFLPMAAFTATPTDGLKLPPVVNNSNPWAGQVLTFQCWFTINAATVF